MLGVANVRALTLDQTAGVVAMNQLFYEQLRQSIMENINSALRGSQASGAGPSS
ncbi:UNVERIFIED_CONTAM: hypothetical protein Sangu_2571600 [Sesamum angustifolium]|uniref:Uncharacterized protein n=1 Tax=Sesamum angustifolium TaxID=2727405 RepID=A0AAW2JA97_9LAMI